MLKLQVVYDIFNNAVPFARMRDNGIYFKHQRSEYLRGKYPQGYIDAKMVAVPFGYATLINN